MADVDRVGADLAAIEARLAKATPGPWHVEESRWDIPGSTEVDRIVCGPTPRGVPRDGIAEVFDGHWVDGEEDPGPAPNLTFIAHAPADIAALVEQVGQLQAENQRLRDSQAMHREWADAQTDRANTAVLQVGQLQGQLARVRVTRDWLRERAEYAGNIPNGFGAAADALDESLGAPRPWSFAWGVPHGGNRQESQCDHAAAKCIYAPPDPRAAAVLSDREGKLNE